MAKAELIEVDAQNWKLSGGLRFDTVVELECQAIRRMPQVQQSLQIDLSGVEHSDSSALALLIAIWRCAKNCNLTLQFTHMPQQLRTIAQLSSLDQVLPLA